MLYNGVIMNLSMRTKAVLNQLKLFDETTYPDPNPLQVGDLISYKDYTDIIIEKGNDYIKLKFHVSLPRSEWKYISVIKKYLPEKDIFESGQKVWWDGAYPSSCKNIAGSWKIEYSKDKPRWMIIKGKYFDSCVGFIYTLGLSSDVGYNCYSYPENVFEKEQK
jgi:hypothetical protein